jgi:anaerobic selenocysteine-containing dehydrogenase
MADEILTPGPKQLRALIVTGGNPLLAMADAGKLRDAFGQLELFVTVDIYRNETGSLAHYTLPATDPLQRPDLPFIFPLMLGLQSRPYLQATEALLPATGNQRDEATIFLDLARACGGGLFGSKIVQRVLERATTRHTAKRADQRRSVPQEALLNLLLKLCRQPSFSNLLKSKNGVKRADHEVGTFLGTKRVVTNDGKVHLATLRLLERAQRLEVDFARELGLGDQLKLISKRQVKSHNTWTHNHESMIRSGDGSSDGDQNHLWMHPDDAASRGLSVGDVVDVATATATVRIPIKILSDLMPGTCAMEHGWGHQHATGMAVASKTRGVNVNLLPASGPANVDPLSNMSQMTGLVVDVRRASGPRDTSDWSGISAAERTNLPSLAIK